MRVFLSFLLSSLFLIQFLTVSPSTSLFQKSIEISCEVHHNIGSEKKCCLLQTKDTSESKKCCSGTTKMACCVMILALYPPSFSYAFSVQKMRKINTQKQELISEYQMSIFHPPILS